MNTSSVVLRSPGLSQIQLVGEKLNESLKKFQLRPFDKKEKDLNAKVKRSYPKPP